MWSDRPDWENGGGVGQSEAGLDRGPFTSEKKGSRSRQNQGKGRGKEGKVKTKEERS